MSEKLEKCALKWTDGKAVVECPDAASVVEAVTIIAKGVQVVQVEAIVKPEAKAPKEKKDEK